MNDSVETSAEGEGSIFGDEPPIGSFFFLRDLVQARKQAGRKATGVLRDYLSVCLKKRRVASPDYYFKFRLYEHGESDREAMHGYIDDIDRRELNVALNSLALSGETIDHKFYLEKLLGQFGIPAASTLAVILRRDGGLRDVVSDAQGLRAVLRDAAFPLFCKPIGGSMSKGAVILDAYDGDRDAVSPRNHVELSLDTFVEQVLERYGEYGYLLQGKLEPHPDMRALSGDAIGSVRIVTLSDERGAEPLYAVWKVPSVGAIADNFWREGNVVAHVDVGTGEVLRCQLGSGTTGREIETHPDTGARLVGVRLPHWEAVRRCTVEAATLFHTLGIIGWDVAVTEEGPRIIEGNTNPDHGLLQTSAAVGLYATEAGRRMREIRAVTDKRVAERKKAAKARDREFRRRQKDQALSEGFRI